MQSWCNCVWGLRVASFPCLALHYTKRRKQLKYEHITRISMISKKRYFGKQVECVAPFDDPYCASDTDFHKTSAPLRERGIYCPNTPDNSEFWICCARCGHRQYCPECCSDAYMSEDDRERERIYRKYVPDDEV